MSSKWCWTGKARQAIGKLSKEQADNARLHSQLEVSESRLNQTEAALDVMGKLHDLLESLSDSTKDDPKPKK